MPSGNTGLLIIRAYVETGSASPLRAEIRLTSDVSGGFERSLTLADKNTVVDVVLRWLDDVLDGPSSTSPLELASHRGDDGGSSPHADGFRRLRGKESAR
jgi:hypothetical protein